MDSRSPTEKRLFLGIPAPAGIFTPLRALQEKLADAPGIRWIADENLHITVFFFGNVAEELIPNLIEMIRIALRGFEPFELIFDQFCLAPKGRDPRMIWARYHKAEAFRLLVRRITDLYEQIQPELQVRRSPVPHVTVARLGGDVGPHYNVPLQANASFRADTLVLWSSDLQPGGAVYEVVARFEL